MTDDLSPLVLARYLDGSATPAERAEVEAWVARDPARPSAMAELQDAWRRGDRSGVYDPHAAWAEGRRRARPVRSRPFVVTPSRRAAPSLAAAAVILVMVGAGPVARILFDGDTPAASAGPMRVATTARGERASFQLPDGTRVLLGVASTLRYRIGAAGPREVVLDGEAYFEVVHDERRPFVVRARDLLAEDLGTQFTVRAYPDDPHPRVVVREGEVGIERASSAARRSPAVLQPGQLGWISPTGEPVVEPADTAAHFAWTTGTLVLDRTTLRDALPQLGRWFDLDFRLADSALGSRRIAATLTHQPTVEALEFLATALGLRVIRQGRVVTFSHGTEESR